MGRQAGARGGLGVRRPRAGPRRDQPSGRAGREEGQRSRDDGGAGDEGDGQEVAAAPTKKTATKPKAATKSPPKETPRRRRLPTSTRRHPPNELTTTSRRRRRRGGDARARRSTSSSPTRSFVVDHPVGSTVDGTVERFSSHGAYVARRRRRRRVRPVALARRPAAAQRPRGLHPRGASATSSSPASIRPLAASTSYPLDIAAYDLRAVDVQSGATRRWPPGGRRAQEPDAEEAPVSPAKKAAKKRATARKTTAKKATAEEDHRQAGPGRRRRRPSGRPARRRRPRSGLRRRRRRLPSGLRRRRRQPRSGLRRRRRHPPSGRPRRRRRPPGRRPPPSGRLRRSAEAGGSDKADPHAFNQAERPCWGDVHPSGVGARVEAGRVADRAPGDLERQLALGAGSSGSRRGSPSAQPDVLCMQETKLADDAFPALTFSALGYESVHHGQGRWNGVAILSKRRARRARGRVLARRGGAPRRGAHRLGHLRRRAGRQRLRAERAVARARAVRVQARVARARCATTSARPATRRADARRVRRLQHRPRRPRRVRPRQVRRFDPRHAGRARRAARAARLGPRRRVPPAPRRRPACTRGGTTAPATSTSTAACASTSCSRRRSSPTAQWSLIDRNARKGKPTPSDHAPLVVEFQSTGSPPTALGLRPIRVAQAGSTDLRRAVAEGVTQVLAGQPELGLELTSYAPDRRRGRTGPRRPGVAGVESVEEVPPVT